MKRLLSLALIACAPVSLAQTEVDYKLIGYGVGHNIGSSLHSQGMQEIDLEQFKEGVADALAGKPPRYSEQQLREAFTALQTVQQEKQAAAAKAQRDVEQKFFEENAKKDGVITTESGLQYRVITQGNGPKPSASDTVSTHYRGTLVDGSEFDSSYSRGQPAEFPLRGVIRGWTEALQLMPVGSKWELFIPAELGYGARSPSPKIPANSTLIFEIELLSIQGQ